MKGSIRSAPRRIEPVDHAHEIRVDLHSGLDVTVMRADSHIAVPSQVHAGIQPKAEDGGGRTWR